jgi:hypothetical protein
MKPGGLFFGIDWFSTRHSEYPNGEAGEDANTRTGFRTGQFSGMGRVHFSDEAHIRDLFGRFEIKVLEHKTIETIAPVPNLLASWLFVAGKGGGT